MTCKKRTSFGVLFLAVCGLLMSCATRTTALIPVASGDWNEVDHWPYDKPYGVYLQIDGVVVSLMRADLEKAKDGSSNFPRIVISIRDEKGGTWVDVRKIKAVRPCFSGGEEVASLDQLIAIERREYASPPGHRYTRVFPVPAPYTAGPFETVSAAIVLKVNPEAITSCTIRLRDAIVLESERQIGDVVFVRGVYEEEFRLN